MKPMLGAAMARTILAAGSLVTVASSASAWDGSVSGVISAVHSVPGAGNYDFRVFLQGQGSQYCGSTNAGAAGWAALHSTDANFKGVQATLMLAYAMRKTVVLYTTRDDNGYCKIGYVAVND